MLTRRPPRRYRIAAAAALFLTAVTAGWVGAQDQPADEAAQELADLRTALQRVQVSFERGRYEKADAELAEWLEDDEGQAPDAGLYRWAGELRFVRGDWADAVRWATKWHDREPERSPGRAAALRRRGEFHIAMGRWDEAKADFTGAEGSHPAEMSALVSLGELAEWSGDKKEAEARYREAIKRYNDRPDGFDPKSVTNLVAAGRAAEGLGRTAGAAEGKPVGDSQMLQQANDAYGKAISLHKHEPDAYLRSGHLFLNNHSDAQGRTFFTDVLKYNRSNPDAQAGVALARQMDFGQQSQAEIHAKRALDVNPHHPLANLVLALLAATTENFAGALAFTDQVIAVNPNHRDGRALRAACLFMLGRTDDYAKEVDQVGSRFPGWAGVPHAVAGLLGNQRRFQEAADKEADAIAIDPYFWHAHIARGMQLLRVGDEENGRKALETGREHYKFDVHATNMLKLLRKMDGFITVQRKHFTMRFHPDEEAIMGPYNVELLEEAWAQQKTNYGGFEPDGPIVYEMFPDAADFAVRTLGLPGLGAVGACFGKVVTMDSPKAMQKPDGQGGQQPAFNWAATAWHEYAHVVTLQLSGGRVPRWFTEGLSEFEEHERNPEWVRPMAEKFAGYYQAKRLTPITEFNQDFTRGDVGFAYYYGGRICDFIKATKGRAAIIGMLKAYGQGKPTPVVIRDVLGWTPAEFDANLYTYLDGQIGHWRLPALYGTDEKAALKQELRDRPDDAALHLKLARAHWQTRKRADAEIHAGRAVRLDESLGEAHFVLGEIMLAKQRTEAAHRRFALAFERGFDDYYLRVRLADVAEAAGETATLVAHLEKAFEYFPRGQGGRAPAHRLASLYFQRGDEAAGTAMLEQAILVAPEDLATRVRLVGIYQRLTDHAKVLRLCREINNVDPFRLDHHRWWAMAAITAQDTPTALREGQMGLLLAQTREDRAGDAGNLTPAMQVETGVAWAVLGHAQHAAGDADEAKDCLAEATTRAPDAEETASLKAKIEAAGK